MVERRVLTDADLDAFLRSSTCADLETFLARLNEACRGCDVKRSYDGSCDGVRSMISLLDAALARVDEFPPLRQSSRFGNAAFRQWLDATREAAPSEMSDRFGSENADELAAYWSASFGNGTRLDFGTGHEASFLVWLYALQQSGASDDLAGMALAVFPRYLDVVHELQTRYRLEPAGSHGVWSLDDYHLLPFVLGSAQLMSPASGSASARSTSAQLAPRPAASLRADAVEDGADMNLYLRAIRRIRRLKTGPFEEHSPLLTDLGKLASWDKVNAGLLLMFRGEVLGKFPVAQHFLFGTLFPAAWESSSSASSAAGEAAAPASVPAAFRARRPEGGDALAKYFNVQRRPVHEQQQQQQQQEQLRQAVDVEHELLPEGRGIVIGGVRVETRKQRISSDAETEAARSCLPALDFPLPEMLFGANTVRVAHAASGVVVEFRALEALCGCKISRAADGTPDRTVFKLPNADQWAQRTDALSGERIKQWRDDYDWTYSTFYEGSLQRGDAQPSEMLSSSSSGGGAGAQEEPSIDYELLKRRDPILFYDEVPLFEDDLFDNGESKLSVKVRVMPSCLFLLARFWLRVDGTFIRCADTRLFHAFGSREIVVEHSRKEMSAEQLRAKGFADATRVMMDEARAEQLMPTVLKRACRIPLEH